MYKNIFITHERKLWANMCTNNFDGLIKVKKESQKEKMRNG